MVSVCDVFLGAFGEGGVHITNDMIVSVAAVESFGKIPNGIVNIKVPCMTIDEFLAMPSGCKIRVVISSFEDTNDNKINDENTISIYGTVVKHGSSSANLDTRSEYSIEFVCAGENLSYLQLLTDIAIPNTSIGAIQKLCKANGATLNIDSSSIATDDAMKWLIVNTNFACALDSILNRSYIENDALFMAYNLDNTIRLGSFNNSFNNKKNVVYSYSKGKVDIVNKLVESGKYKTLAYYDSKNTSTPSIKSAIGSKGTTNVSVPTIKNTQTVTNGAIAPNTQAGKDNQFVGVVTTNVTGVKDIVKTGNPNVHSKYTIASKYRDAVYAEYGHAIELYASGESEVRLGDVIDIVVPVVGTAPSNTASTIMYSKALSGPYIAYTKTYYFSNQRFEVSVGFIRKYNYVDKPEEYLKNFGIKKEEIA